ncbi:dTDP-4-dehydrorhamnose reductase [Shewanella sp. 202IG2-18]|uniref:dTDP-4-dehydrorhamnose reductase n=1 Tax=Parashewanella hymeniacidonis TaxID=2807618 RepID=UPI0019615E1B|nr:dTDP-4-dehydrorhamnose reductase [Parashewanella hymeniacidonis]MBM7072097.1 dTDP-4-dehydrorhamnose reductase [Parashewanella hymeniacidonis]
MKVIVTGSNGQVGYCLVEQLKARKDIELFAYDREQLDITNEKQVKDIVSNILPNVIINAAAHTAVDKAESEVELSYAINRDGPKYLAQAAEHVGAALLHISTDYVFDGASTIPYLETDKTNPQTVYGKSKLAGEQEIVKYCSKFAIMRTAWVFGEHGNNFVKTMLKLARTRPELGIIGDQFGGPTYAGDIAASLLVMMEKLLTEGAEVAGCYHFSGSPHVSWYQFSSAIFEKGQSSDILEGLPLVNEISTEQYPTPAPRPANSKLNCDSIFSIFGISPSDWKAALNNIKEYK